MAIASKFCAVAKSKEVARPGLPALHNMAAAPNNAIFANPAGSAMRPRHRRGRRLSRPLAVLAAMQKTLEIHL